MRLISTINKNRLLGALWRVCWPVLVLGYIIWIFSGSISPKIALASNIYIDDISWYNSGGHTWFTFHTLTSFTTDYAEDWQGVGCHAPDFYVVLNKGGGGGIFHIPYAYTGGSCGAGGEVTFTAGQNYAIYMTTLGEYDDTWYIDYIYHYGPNWDDQENYSFSQMPSLTITFPGDDEEMVANFYITGSWTQPAEDPSGFLQVDTMPAGTLSSSLISFWQSIQSATSGAVSIWVGNLSAGYYDFRIYFRGGAYDFYEGAVIQNIHIVNDLPYALPPYGEGEAYYPPASYNPLNPITYYQENSTYATSTALYDTLTGVLAPMLLGIGNSLTQYSANFTPSNASSTGNQLGQAVVLVRSYLLNLNSFFNGFPVSQFLMLYLIALVLVVVIRLVKNLIHLGKPI
jgi:hypothetical protein